MIGTLYGNICDVEAFVARMTIHEDPGGNRKLEKSRIRDVTPVHGIIPLGEKN